MKTIFALLLVMSLSDVSFAARNATRKLKKVAKLAVVEEVVELKAVGLEPMPVIKPPVFADEISCHAFTFFDHTFEMGEEKTKRAMSGNGYSVTEAILDSQLSSSLKQECTKAYKVLGIVSKAVVQVNCTSTPVNVERVNDVGNTTVVFKDTQTVDCLYLLDGR